MSRPHSSAEFKFLALGPATPNSFQLAGVAAVPSLGGEGGGLGLGYVEKRPNEKDICP